MEIGKKTKKNMTKIGMEEIFWITTSFLATINFRAESSDSFKKFILVCQTGKYTD